MNVYKTCGKSPRSYCLSLEGSAVEPACDPSSANGIKSDNGGAADTEYVAHHRALVVETGLPALEKLGAKAAANGPGGPPLSCRYILAHDVGVAVAEEITHHQV